MFAEPSPAHISVSNGDCLQEVHKSSTKGTLIGVQCIGWFNLYFVCQGVLILSHSSTSDLPLNEYFKASANALPQPLSAGEINADFIHTSFAALEAAAMSNGLVQYAENEAGMQLNIACDTI